MNTKFLPLLAMAFLFIGCGHQQHEPHANAHSEQHEVKHAGSIQLNNGQKWQINPEMKPFLKRSEELVAAYASGEQKDYKVLAEELQESNRQLVASCTMKGASHDELHKWLAPHMQLIKKLSQAKSAQEAEKTVEELQASFSQFKQYFR